MNLSKLDGWNIMESPIMVYMCKWSLQQHRLWSFPSMITSDFKWIQQVKCTVLLFGYDFMHCRYNSWYITCSITHPIVFVKLLTWLGNNGGVIIFVCLKLIYVWKNLRDYDVFSFLSFFGRDSELGSLFPA